MKYDIFISYSRKDSAIVERYYDYLIAAELSVWLDKDGIETGDEFKKKIVHAIMDSNVFLFFSSVNSNTSPWTVKEVNVAVNYKKKIIPVKLDITPYEESIMFDLAGLDFFDHANNGFEIGVGKLLAAFGKNVEDVNKEVIRRKNEQERLHKEAILHQKGVVKTRIQNRKKNDGWKWGCIIAAISILGVLMIVLNNNGDTNAIDEGDNYVTEEEEDYTGEDNGTTGKTHELYSTCTIKIGEHEAVDLGLPSGTRWATCNIGACTPEEYGDYFAWGETIGNKTNYDWSTYKWSHGEYYEITKYSTSSWYGTEDNMTILDSQDDAATAKWGSKWRMPTQDEISELINNCSWTWKTKNGVKGSEAKSKINNCSIFLPAAGYHYNDRLEEAGSYGFYWSCSLNTLKSENAYHLWCKPDEVEMDFGDSRCYGLSVRPVCSK